MSHRVVHYFIAQDYVFSFKFEGFCCKKLSMYSYRRHSNFRPSFNAFRMIWYTALSCDRARPSQFVSCICRQGIQQNTCIAFQSFSGRHLSILWDFHIVPVSLPTKQKYSTYDYVYLIICFIYLPGILLLLIK